MRYESHLKGVLSVFILLLLPLSVMAQLEASNWYFGYGAGLDFSNCDPLALTDGQLNQDEGCATISDEYGNLLFYTDGIVIYNANHQLMLNGTGLLGDPSSTQSAIIIPNPTDSNIYYVFTVAAQADPDGLSYSVVNMSLDGGLGGIVTNKKNIQLHTPVAEKLTATYHANENDIWVIAHEMDTNNFLAYLVTASGVNSTPIMSAVGSIHLSIGAGTGAIGYLKASPDGTKLASAISFLNVSLELFDFDNATGVISNPRQITDNYGAYGVEFSSNSQVLYTTNRNLPARLFQYDVSLPDLQSIQSSEILIATDTLRNWGGLQIGIDGKIYLAQNVDTTLSVINAPNKVGVACNFVDDDISLSGKESRMGLPPFIQSYFQYEISYKDQCFGEETQLEVLSFSAPNNVNWDFGDPGSGSENTATGTTITHLFSAPGTYTVTANLITAVNCPIILTQEITIFPSPQLTQPDDLMQCGKPVFDLEQTISVILGTDQNATDFTFTYYKTLAAAETGVPDTEISSPEAYTIETPPKQTIYVRVKNEFGCYATTQFDIVVNPKAEVSISAYDGMAICMDLDPNTPVIDGNYEPILIDTGLSGTEYIFEWTLNGAPLSESGPSIMAVVGGEYSVTVTDITSTDPSCSVASTAVIIESNPPEYDVQTVFFSGEVSITNVTGNGDYIFSIDGNGWREAKENGTLAFTGISAGEHIVYGRDKNGCGTTPKTIWLINYMKFVTPNSDGYNDRWNIIGLEDQPDAKILIFDRYGKFLESIHPAGPGWDGTYDGKPMPSNDYWFRLEYVSSNGTPSVFQANFTLKR